MPSTFAFYEPTALAAGIEALFVQGTLFRPMPMDWADFGPLATGSLEGWFATIDIGTLAVVQYRYPPLPAASAVPLTKPTGQNPKFA